MHRALYWPFCRQAMSTSCSLFFANGLCATQRRSLTTLSRIIFQTHQQVSNASALSSTHGSAEMQAASSAPLADGVASASIIVSYTPGSGSAGTGGNSVLHAPTTSFTRHCDIITESFSKTDELLQHKKAQEALGAGAGILTADAIDEMMEELREVTTNAVDHILQEIRSTPVVQQAGMHELRRTLFYTTSLQARGWIDTPRYTAIMRALTVEFLRRDNAGVLAPDDVLYVTTFTVAAGFYNRHLWNRMERALGVYANFEHIELATVKALTTKLSKTRRGCPKEALDMRRKVLAALTRRIGVLANDFDLPSLLGVLQCYCAHDMASGMLEPLAIRATNHVKEFTPQECATLMHVLRRFRLLRLEVCERLVERICTSDVLNQHMAKSALAGIRTCYNRISDGGRNALHAEPTRQKLRALGEQVGCRLDEVEFPVLGVILGVLDVIVNLKIYVPKKPLQAIFSQADAMLRVVTEHQDNLVDLSTGKRVRPITAEEGRHLQALLLHYGSDLCPELLKRLKSAFTDGLLPDEASL